MATSYLQEITIIRFDTDNHSVDLLVECCCTGAPGKMLVLYNIICILVGLAPYVMLLIAHNIARANM